MFSNERTYLLSKSYFYKEPFTPDSLCHRVPNPDPWYSLPLPLPFCAPHTSR